VLLREDSYHYFYLPVTNGFFYYLSANSVLCVVQAKKPRQSLQNEYAF